MSNRPKTMEDLQALLENENAIRFEGEDVPNGPRSTIAKHADRIVNPDVCFFLVEEKKYAVQLKCADCGDESRLVRTSDLHQVHYCFDCASKNRKERAKEKRAAKKELVAAAAKVEDGGEGGDGDGEGEKKPRQTRKRRSAKK